MKNYKDKYNQWVINGTIVPGFEKEEEAINALEERSKWVPNEEEIKEIKQEQLNLKSKSELKEEDWIVIRELERLYLKDTTINIKRENLRNQIIEKGK
jgi:hypothetical protein